MANQYIDELLKDIDMQSSILAEENHSFLLDLMIISSYVIQADGKIMHSEMEFVRNFLLQNFGQEKKERYEKLLLNLFAESKKYTPTEWVAKIESCTREMVHYTTEEQRILLLAFLIRIVKADGVIDYQEVGTVRNVSVWLGIDHVASDRIEQLNNEVFWSWMR